MPFGPRRDRSVRRCLGHLDQSRSSCTRTPAAGREASSYPQHPRDLNPASGGNEERATLPPGSRVLRQTRHNFTAHSFAERLCCSCAR